MAKHHHSHHDNPIMEAAANVADMFTKETDEGPVVNSEDNISPENAPHANEETIHDTPVTSDLTMPDAEVPKPKTKWTQAQVAELMRSHYENLGNPEAVVVNGKTPEDAHAKLIDLGFLPKPTRLALSHSQAASIQKSVDTLVSDLHANAASPDHAQLALRFVHKAIDKHIERRPGTRTKATATADSPTA